MRIILKQNLVRLIAIIFCFGAFNSLAQTVAPFFAPSVTSGQIEVKLYPMENVVPGTPTLVTFGVPFTRGSLLTSELSKIRVLSSPLTTGPEIPAYVQQVTPWRHTTNLAVDSQSVRIVKVQIMYTFTSAYPNYETIYVEYGVSNRLSNVATMQNSKTAWHLVTTGSFLSTDNIQEPDVYAVFTKQFLSDGAVKLSRMLPLDAGVPLGRENPAIVDVATYPGYVKKDHGQHNFFFSIINEDDPLVTLPNSCPYKTDFEPWLYDRVTAMYNLYMQSGNIKALREAVRNAQFYKSQLYDNTTTPTNAIGVFKLKVLTPGAYVGNNGAMYSYNEGLAYTYWLASDDDMLAPINWVVNAHEQNNPPTLWSPSAGSWTERFTSFRLIANTVGYEVTGNTTYKNSMISQSNDLIWHQNGAGGILPANRIDGGLYHYGSQHGDGTPTAYIASSWMTALISEAMIRVYGVTEDVTIANFIKRIGTFEKAALKLDAAHTYTSSNPGALWYGDYIMLFDGTSDERDGSEVEHSMDVSVTLAWAAYFANLTGTPDNTLITAANDAYASYNVGVNYWIRPTAPSSGFTAYRVTPWRKYGWEYTPSASFSWLMNTLTAPTGIKTDNNTIASINIYPNPASDVIIIDCKEKQELLISVYAITGSKIFEINSNEITNQINIAALPNGIYIVKALGKHCVTAKKIIKE